MSERGSAVENYGVVGVNQHSVVKMTGESLHKRGKCGQKPQTVIDKVNRAVTLSRGGKRRKSNSASAVCLSWVVQYHSIGRDRKSTRLNSSHVKISYAVFCLKK